MHDKCGSRTYRYALIMYMYQGSMSIPFESYTSLQKIENRKSTVENSNLEPRDKPRNLREGYISFPSFLHFPFSIFMNAQLSETHQITQLFIKPVLFFGFP